MELHIDNTDVEIVGGDWVASHEVNHTLTERCTDRPFDPNTTLRSQPAPQQITVVRGAHRDDSERCRDRVRPSSAQQIMDDRHRSRNSVDGSTERSYVCAAVEDKTASEVGDAGTTRGAQRGATFSSVRGPREVSTNSYGRDTMNHYGHDATGNSQRLESTVPVSYPASGVQRGTMIAAVRGQSGDFRRGGAIATVGTRSRAVEVESRLDELNAEISQLQRVFDERARDNNYARLQQSMNQSSTVADYTDGARTRRTTVRPSTSGRRDDEEWTGSDDWRVDSDITFRRRHPARDERI